VGCLRELGWKDSRILEHVSVVQADGDPAVDPTLMDRLEGLLDLVALAMEEYDNALVASVPTLSTPQINGASTAALLAGDSRVLPMLSTPTGKTHLRERTTISFWAPNWLITQ